MKRTSLALVAVVFAVGLTFGAESAAPTQPAATPDQAAAAADQPATTSTDTVTVASNKLPGEIVPYEINGGGTCPTVSGSSCPPFACVDPNGGGEVCHKIGCSLTNTGMHACIDGEGEPFLCGPGKTIWVSACQCGCLGESCGSYGSWYCK